MMNNQEFKELTSKYLKGIANPSEEQRLLEAYSLLENRHEVWDETLLGNEEIFKAELYGDIKDQIALYEARRRQFPFLKIAASVLVFIAIGLSTWHFRSSLLNYVDPIGQLTSSTGGEIRQIGLADGSRVWLNSGSKLIYPEKFRSGGLREVSLTGEAYFEVAHKEGSPFIIHTDKINTTVLGTKFNVKAYSQEAEIAVTVVSGKVGVSSRGSTGVQFVSPNEKVTYNKSTRGFSRSVLLKASNETGWTEGKLTFDNEPLSGVVPQLERRYQVKVTFDTSLAGCPVFADFNNEPIDNILKILALSFRGTAIKQADGYYISGKGCK